MKAFSIPEEYLCSQTLRSEWSMYADHENLTNEQLIKVMKGEDRCASTTSIDHPEFTKLREELFNTGFIEIERRWWNGDRALKPFSLNGIKFKTGDQFSCAGALGCSLQFHKKQNGKNSTSSKRTDNT